ncbi:MAG: alanine--tRNA ligase [Salibacteraceae bacterium]|nr:alanine--tRNA ligase [Salibacteraceae bacterium]|tara:strand:+ start:31401 stop:34013 length:2613 start_codon:yes stop_codon:yes gene_type:complete
MNWEVNEIRQKFLEFFESKGHLIEASAPMVVKNDPTLMFTNAGMNQFKDIFLGNRASDIKRISNSQKCLRVSGKHNDLEEVGVDTYHHTMFEMLGNWSFGDYFKEDAINWAWELLTEVYKLDKDRLYVTVFEGDKEDSTEADIEAEDIWSKLTDKDRIIRCDKKDNFWEMGEMGPCGPCSEIHIDLRPEADRRVLDGKSLVNKDHPLVIEIWNLVFIQFNRDSKGKLSDLPNKHVDTGMGLERLAMALQKKQSNYDTDVFSPMISKLEILSKKVFKSSDSKEDVAFRVISDHVRAVSFSIADGQLPSNTGAGYVIRRILRRAVRYGYSFLDFDQPFMHELVPVLIEQLGDHFIELKAQEKLIGTVIKEEEESFLRTLAKGIVKLEKALKSSSKIEGKQAFELYDTFGFPIDLTELIALEHNALVDMDGFTKELELQKNRSRNSNVVTTDDWIENENNVSQIFTGYDELTSEAIIIKYREIETKGKKFYQIVLNKTPFYPQGGGQVGDAGILKQDTIVVKVIDTKKENDLIIVTTKDFGLNLNSSLIAEVDISLRKLAQANHTATHLLHLELRKLLGNHVEQKGSFVSGDYLRFDFSHFQKISSDQLKSIEEKVNDLVFDNLLLKENRTASMEEANEAGAMMLFGEKYGDKVRMIGFGESVELCGGTHVSQTSEIRLFKITGESSVAAGIRRIEAITSNKALEYLNGQQVDLNIVKSKLQNSKQPIKALEEVLENNVILSEQMLAVEKVKAKEFKSFIEENTELNSNDIKSFFGSTTVPAKNVKDVLFELKATNNDMVIGIASLAKEKVTVSLLVCDAIVESKSLMAGEGIKLISKAINGGGGGQSFFATAGGKNLKGIEEAFLKLKDWIS